MSIEIVYAREPLGERRPLVFLAGPTPRSDTVASWRPAAIEALRRHGYTGVIANPESRPGTLEYASLDDDTWIAQHTWEWDARTQADIIMYWVPRQLPEMAAFTTNIEFGLDLHTGRILFGCPPDAPKTRYLRRSLEVTGQHAYDTLDELAEAVTDATSYHPAATATPVIVASGGTSEPIDDVRHITNFATGRFTNQIAAAMRRRGHTTHLVCSPAAHTHAELTEHTSAPVADTRHTFRSTSELAATLAELETATRIEPAELRRRNGASRIVFWGAAISDYQPTSATTGKLASDAEQITVELARSPKLIDDARTQWGPDTFLAGFKLLAGATTAELIAAGHTLCKRARLNLVIANDLHECRDGQHPVWLIGAEGSAIRATGSRAEVAEQIAAHVTARANVTWSATRSTATLENTAAPAHAAATLRFAQQAGLLAGTDGNVCVRDTASPAGQIAMWVTPRGANKRTLGADAFIHTVHDLATRINFHPAGTQKPSIDTPVQARLFAAHPQIDTIVHSHDLFGRTDATTTFAYPCGVTEEALEVLAALDDTHPQRAGERASFTVELVHHGLIAGLHHTELSRLEAEYQQQAHLYREHLAEIDAQRAGTPSAQIVRITPIIDTRPESQQIEVAGAAGWTADGRISVHLDPSRRSGGLGAVVAAQLARRHISVITVDECAVIGFWERHGYTTTRNADGTVTCTPT